MSSMDAGASTLTKLLTGSVLALAFCSLAACGQVHQMELPGEEINCEWFADNGNCWRAGLRSFSSSLPAQTEQGSLSADGKLCTYDGDYEVVFINPIPIDKLGDRNGLKDFKWDFEARLGGDFLMSYRDPDDASLLVQTPQGTFLLEAQYGGVVITCPSQTQYNVPIASLLQTCPSETLPGKVTTWDLTGVTFVLRGMGGTDLLVFDCLAP